LHKNILLKQYTGSISVRYPESGNGAKLGDGHTWIPHKDQRLVAGCGGSGDGVYTAAGAERYAKLVPVVFGPGGTCSSIKT